MLCSRNLGADNNDPLGLAGRGDDGRDPGPRQLRDDHRNQDSSVHRFGPSGYETRRGNASAIAISEYLLGGTVAPRSIDSRRAVGLWFESTRPASLPGALDAPAASGTPTATGAPSRSTPRDSGRFLGRRCMSAQITHAELLVALSYAPKTGEWKWKVRASRKTVVGDVAGSSSDGYRKIRFRFRYYRSARLAWFYMTGEWPPLLIDHINGDRGDDRWANLRLATFGQNSVNRLGWGRSKLRGVYQPRGSAKWCAYIKEHGRARHLGTFPTKDAAAAAYDAVAAQLYGEFVRHE